MTTPDPRRAAEERQDEARMQKLQPWLDALTPAERTRIRRLPLLQQEAEMALAQLPKDQRRALEKIGIKSVSDSHRVSGHAPHEQQDAAESHRASVTPENAGVTDQLADQLAEMFELPPRVAQDIAAWHASQLKAARSQTDSTMLCSIAGVFLRENNVKVSAAGLAFALNMGALNGLGSIREYAAASHLSPEAVSKKQRWWRQELNLPPSPHCKSDKARARLSDAQKVKHWKKKSFRHHKAKS